ncbi:hypothetical protein [Streptomyces sp. NBC_00878]|uniref:hypothetical protein n=1 Tax=Streptomyces sp. NBC_00878 TaxID=2975854 RepID=UPI00225A555E|nr:hypothetical protein [Streptomyces sp. NBC_00878]MCX4911853.1 hypothetical protein [Streptomyces sp. NBC_00878]
MRRRVSRREIVRRLEAVEAQLAQRPAPLLPGQEAITVATIGHHTYLGPGLCREDLYGTICGAHRDAHQLIAEEDLL